MFKRLAAMAFIVLATTLAWFILSEVMDARTNEAGGKMRDAVGGLWGSVQAQTAPSGRMEWTETKREKMSEAERLAHKSKLQQDENTRAEVEGVVPRAVVGSVEEIGRILEKFSQTERKAFLERRQREEDELAAREGRAPRRVVYEQRRERGSKSRKLQDQGGGRLVVLGADNLYSVAPEPAEFILLTEEDFIKKTEIEKNRELEPASSDIIVDLDLDYRKKGLLWFSTYEVAFASVYKLTNPVDHEVRVLMRFPLPSADGVYENLVLDAKGGRDLETRQSEGCMEAVFKIGPSDRAEVKYAYETRGLSEWYYRFGDDSTKVKNFRLVMNTDFDRIDFPPDSISPDEKTKRADEGWTLVWDKKSLVSAINIGMVMPTRLNPGPLASAISFHAPVTLLFFFYVLFMMQTLRGIKLHPMNYFFLACGFFAFNLLFSYLVDHLPVTGSFLIASAVSIFLVVSYLKLVAGARFAMVEAGLSQFVYQFLFSLAHFFPGFTGLAITVVAILTLFLTMRFTAKIDWEDKFKDTDWGVFIGKLGRKTNAPTADNVVNP